MSWFISQEWHMNFSWCFQKLWKNLFKKLSLNPVKFLSALGLSWQAALKKTEVKLELLTGIDMLLILEKGIRGGICKQL